MRILALDISSTYIGVVLVDGPALVEHKTWRLRGQDHGRRCRAAVDALDRQLQADPDVDLVAIEAPVGKFAKAIIPQARVSGAVLALLAERRIAWVEIAPAAAKKALTNKGNADKAAMIAAANLPDEHQADALGIARAAQQLRVEVTR